tara:strand:- start:268 stop:543 length:276 start_codon:yes stop_codon:yes gene_type:complete
MHYLEKELIKIVKPMILTYWNVNNEFEECLSIDINFVYVPKEYLGDNPPKIRFKLIMANGREQESLNCSKPFIETVNYLTLITYKKMLGIY